MQIMADFMLMINRSVLYLTNFISLIQIRELEYAHTPGGAAKIATTKANVVSRPAYFFLTETHKALAESK